MRQRCPPDEWSKVRFKLAELKPEMFTTTARFWNGPSWDKNRGRGSLCPVASLSDRHLPGTDGEDRMATATTAATRASVPRGYDEGVISREWLAVGIHALEASYRWCGRTHQGSAGHGESPQAKKNETSRGRCLPGAGSIRTDLQPVHLSAIGQRYGECPKRGAVNPGNGIRHCISGGSLGKRRRRHEQRKDKERKHSGHGGRLSFQSLLQGFVQNLCTTPFRRCWLHTKWDVWRRSAEIVLIRAFSAGALLHAERTLEVHTLAGFKQYRFKQYRRGSEK